MKKRQNIIVYILNDDHAHLRTFSKIRCVKNKDVLVWSRDYSLRVCYVDIV